MMMIVVGSAELCSSHSSYSTLVLGGAQLLFLLLFEESS